ncbi:MAG: nucleotidyltransferase family protein [Anaerolineales bacterium]|nr:MAG: nucleotidyltransferase family protein [Anaerolineales bacterium]
MNRTVYQLLALCARAECSAAHYHQIARAATRLTDWEEAVCRAEAHGMAPLLYTYLNGAGVELSLSVKRKLQGLYLQHHHANRVRTRVLHDVLAAYYAAGIPALVLKGAALAHMVYPEPGLRPMSDVDILVPESDARRAQEVLADLGFRAPLPPGSILLHRHLTEATLHTESVPVMVEIHLKLFSDYFDNLRAYVRSLILPALRHAAGAKASRPRGVPSDQATGQEVEGDQNWMALEGLTIPPTPFTLGDLTAYTLGHEDMLWYLCQHLTSHVNAWDFGRLIWVADVVSFAERFASEVDWDRIRRQHPAVLDTLSLLHFMTPLSDELLSAAPIKIGRAPEKIGVEYQGWPRTRVGSWRERGYRRVLGDTLFPSEWWLRLRYKLGSARSLFWYRWVRHPLYIMGHIIRAMLEWMGWPTSHQLARGGPQRDA